MSGLAGIGAALKLARIAAFLKAIPRPVWIAVAVLSILLVGSCAHKRAVKKAHDAAYAQGVSDTEKSIEKQALELKRKADELSAKISRNLKDRNNEENRAIAGRADSLRLLGPGKAACPGGPGLPGASGGNGQAGGQSSAPLARLPYPEGLELIGLPFAPTVGTAENCDLNRAEVLAWREWYRRQSESWPR